MTKLENLTRDQLRSVAAAAIWGFDIWAATPEGHDYWYNFVSGLEDSEFGNDVIAEEADADQGDVLAADALSLLGPEVYGEQIAKLRDHAERRVSQLPPGSTVAPPRVTDVG